LYSKSRLDARQDGPQAERGATILEDAAAFKEKNRHSDRPAAAKAVGFRPAFAASLCIVRALWLDGTNENSDD
jgi:hypothetical protein